MIKLSHSINCQTGWIAKKIILPPHYMKGKNGIVSALFAVNTSSFQSFDHITTLNGIFFPMNSLSINKSIFKTTLKCTAQFVFGHIQSIKTFFYIIVDSQVTVQLLYTAWLSTRGDILMGFCLISADQHLAQNLQFNISIYGIGHYGVKLACTYLQYLNWNCSS